jgi:hypothetical protein
MAAVVVDRVVDDCIYAREAKHGASTWNSFVN